MSVLNLLNSAWEAIADWRRRERAYGELMALDDRCSPISAFGALTFRLSSTRGYAASALTPKALRWR